MESQEVVTCCVELQVTLDIVAGRKWLVAKYLTALQKSHNIPT
jgi:hypothetical protein